MIYSASNGKKFCFYRQDIHCMINGFYNNFMFSLNVWDWDSDITSDTHNKNGILIVGRFLI